MQIYFRQIYAQSRVNFPFSHVFQKFMSDSITKFVEPSLKFLKGHGEDWDLTFNISAKWQLAVNEIVGPARFRKDKSVEYSIFLPHTPIMQQAEPNRCALEHLFEGVYEVLGGYEIDVSKLKAEQVNIINEVMTSSEMFEKEGE